MKLRFLSLVSIVLLLAVYRIVPHPPNFAPIMAAGLFAGAHFVDRRTAFLVPLLAMLLADLVLGFHASMIFVYAGLALAVGLGMLIRHRRRPLPVTLAALSGSLGFFLISNIGAWLMMSPAVYSRDWNGLLQAYIAAIPFYRNSLLADALFTAVLFGGWALAERHFAQLRDRRPGHA